MTGNTNSRVCRTGTESRLRFIASWTRMDTDPTAWPLHENRMLEEEQRLIQQESPLP